jgi:hypothetical protein
MGTHAFLSACMKNVRASKLVIDVAQAANIVGATVKACHSGGARNGLRRS